MMTKHSKSKKHSLAKLADNWRESIFSSIKSIHLKRAVAVLSASGCRPAELERGILVRLKAGILSIGIHGSKVDEEAGRGQPLRLLDIDQETPWGRFLLEQVSVQPNFAIIVKYDAGGISQRLREKSRELWPRRKSLVSAYSYRHFIGKSMKESGESSDKIARVLGHATDFSQHSYGRVGGGKLNEGQHGVLHATSSNPIRHSHKSDRYLKFVRKVVIKKEMYRE